MLGFPNAKINIGLNITGKRGDGFHDLESLFYPVGLCDILEITRGPSDLSSGTPLLTATGRVIGGPVEKNLCMKAAKLVGEKYTLPSVRIHLHKIIPPGSGLGGGSSDAAFVIKLLNREFSLGMSEPETISLAEKAGSDCPFFIQNRPALVRGKGDIIIPVKPFLSGYYLILVIPGIHIDTSWAYSKIIPSKPEESLSGLIAQPVERWKNRIKNDFEEIVYDRYREIAEIQHVLYDSGAVFSSMSGSGSAVYGIFTGETGVPDFPAGFFTWTGKM
ncbi:MAG: 4-(cytidine 5'-diphospho)-2-C-methyl-D-erythritol kinase [Bacteroidales bacterium]|nr:MAG: 4-(cytidine 5'-diphospho)-2-C-methyl-D-erythritol kinase [Bacteroidales bacterium]